jgi:hypothetical protein
VTNEAVRQYYWDRYGLRERDLAAVRSIVGVLRRAQLRNVAAKTFMIERVSPVSAADEAYLIEAIFRDTWGDRLPPICRLTTTPGSFACAIRSIHSSHCCARTSIFSRVSRWR